jgi:hypothetical protein
MNVLLQADLRRRSASCMKLRRQRDSRTRKVQILFETITVDAPRIRVCPRRRSLSGPQRIRVLERGVQWASKK